MNNKSDSPVARMQAAVRIEWPTALIDALSQSEAPDLNHVKSALAEIDRESLEDLATFGLVVSAGVMKYIAHDAPASSTQANSGVQASAPSPQLYAEGLEFNIKLIERIERESRVVRQNIKHVLTDKGTSHRKSDTIRTELEAANREYRRVANTWLDADDHLGIPSEEDEAVKFFQEIQTTMKPLVKKRLQLADELAAAEIRELLATKMQVLRSEQARHAAEALHDKPDGSRAKREAIRKIWASGKYDSRDRCAEQECAGLGMSFTIARKALINTPDPA